MPKLNTMKKYFLLLLTILSFYVLKAQNLTAGDIAFVQINCDNPDNFKFVALVEIPPNEVIQFTDNGWKSSGGFRSGEGIITWTAPNEGVPCGTVVEIEPSSNYASTGSISKSGNFALSSSGDQIIAYYQTGTDSYNMIAAINDEQNGIWQADATNSNTSALPTGLTNGTDAVALNEKDNYKYNGIVLNGTKSELLAAINDNNNWDGDNSSQENFSGSFTVSDCSCDEPTTNASNLNLSPTDCGTIDVSFTAGDGSRRIVLVKEDAPVDASPTDGVTYNADNNFGNGDELGSGNFVVYNGNGTSFTLIGLKGGHTYYFKVFEYNCSGSNADYLTDGNELSGSITLNPCPVNNLHITCLTNTTATISWDNPNYNYTGVVIGIREGTNPPHSLNSYDASSLTADPNFGDGTQYGSTTPYSYVVYKGTGNSLTITGLTKGNDYVIKAYTYLNENSTIWSLDQPTLSISGLAVADVSDPHTVPYSGKIDLSWTNPSTCYDEIMVVATDNGSVSATPSGDGSSYIADPSYGNGTEIAPGEYVVYKGTEPFTTTTNLTNGTTYCFKIFVRKGSDWSDGIEICETPQDITEFKPGDLIFVAYDTKTSGYDCQQTPSTDVFYILTMVDIKPGTEFGLLNASYEYGAAANERTDVFWSCTSTPGEYTPSRVTLRWNGSNNITKGSIIKVFIPNYGPPTHVYINGTEETSNFDLSGSYVNMSETQPDQVWIYQGVLADYGTSPHIYSRLFGHILFGLSNMANWVPFDQEVNTPRTSRLHPDIQCFNLDFDGDVPVNYYKLSATHTGSKRTLLQAIMNENNWEQVAQSECDDIPSDIATTTFTILNGNPEGTWIGDADNDWFNCANWEALTVPEKSVDVYIDGNSQQDPVIDVSNSANAKKFDSTAVCKNLYIYNHTLFLGNPITNEGDTADILKVFGNLIIDNNGALSMNTGDSQDGKIYLFGNWANNRGNTYFDEGKGTIIFCGTQNQTIASATQEDFANLIIENHAQKVSLNTDITADTLYQNLANIDLNGYNLTLEGPYYREHGKFIGNASSDFNIINSGYVDTLYFTNNQTLNNLNIDRNSQIFLGTNLEIQNDLNIYDGEFNVFPNVFLTVNGTLNNQVGSSGLILHSDATGTASLIHNTTDVPATCERYMTAGAWHYFFSPLDACPITNLTTTSWNDQNPNLYWYDETQADYWWAHDFCSNVMGWQSVSTTNFETNKGYIFYEPENRVHTLTGGNLFAGDKTFNLSYTISGVGTVNVCDGNNTPINWREFDGWNLIGNPYPSAIDWDQVNEMHNVENVIYYYDGTVDNYKYYRPSTGGGTVFNHGITVNGGSKYVPAHQAFFVKATQPGAWITIENSARVHNPQPYWKNQQEAPNIVRLQLIDNGYTDETVIQIADPATYDFDEKYDAHKRFAYNEQIPQIFSYDSLTNTFYAINTLPQDDILSVPLGYYFQNSGNKTLIFKSITLKNYYIWLEDKLTGQTTEITQPTTYQFEANSGITKDRFILHFNKNHAPYPLASISDISVNLNETFYVKLPNTLFDDIDFWDKNLSIKVSLANGDTLPQWIKFDNNRIYGVPTQLGDFPIKITAIDKFGATANIVFTIHVNMGVSNINQTSNTNRIIYPNPASTFIKVNLKHGEYNYSIINSIGKCVLTGKLQTNNPIINISSLPEGVYNIEIRNKETYFAAKFIKQ